jgi:hypothetical protein
MVSTTTRPYLTVYTRILLIGVVALAALMGACSGPPSRRVSAPLTVNGDSQIMIRFWRVVGPNDLLYSNAVEGSAGTRLTDEDLRRISLRLLQELNSPLARTPSAPSRRTTGLFGPNVVFVMDGGANTPLIRWLSDPSLDIPRNAPRPPTDGESIILTLMESQWQEELVNRIDGVARPVVNVFFGGYRSTGGDIVFAYTVGAKELQYFYNVDPDTQYGLSQGIIVVNDDARTDQINLFTGNSESSSVWRIDQGSDSTPMFAFRRTIPHEMNHMFGSWRWLVRDRYLRATGSNYDDGDHDVNETWGEVRNGVFTKGSRFSNNILKPGSAVPALGTPGTNEDDCRYPLIIPGSVPNLKLEDIPNWVPDTDLGWVWRRLRTGEAFRP